MGGAQRCRVLDRLLRGEPFFGVQLVRGEAGLSYFTGHVMRGEEVTIRSWRLARFVRSAPLRPTNTANGSRCL